MRALLLFVFLAPLAAPVVAQSPATAVHCGQLFDSRSGKVLGPHTVLVRDGRIAQVTSGGHADVAGVPSIDLSGHTCTPGWTDLHVHLASQSSPDSYSEGFRLDDVDYAFRAVGYAKKTLLACFACGRYLRCVAAPHVSE